LEETLKLVPTPLHSEAGPIWCNKVFHPKRHDLTWSEFAELCATKMEDQFLA